MVEVPPTTTVVTSNNLGGQALGFLMQVVSWLAFGACFYAGWHFMEWLIKKS